MSLWRQIKREHRRKVELDPTALARPEWPQLGIRFAFGAGIALGAALVGEKFGPLAGGVFLAFPAILPAALTLLERKEGMEATDIDAVGATWGAVALLVFAVTVAALAGRVAPAVAILLAAAAWCLAAGALFLGARALLGRISA